MKKNIWIIVLLAALVVMAVVVARQNRQIAQLKEQLASTTAAMEQAKQQLASASKKSRHTESLPASSPVVSVPAPASVPAAVPQAGTGVTTNFMAHVATMMKNPQMKEVVRAQQKVLLARQYGSLNEYLGLPAERLDALKELLSDRQMELVDSGMAMMASSESERIQALEKSKTIKAEYDKKIQELLGSQDYQVFQDYERTITERMSVWMFEDTLPASDALSNQQVDDLIAAMYDERKALPASSLMNNQTPDPSQMTEERIAETLKQMEQLQQRYAQRAEAILTPAQQVQFTKWQQQMSAVQAAGLKMAAQMYGNKGTPQPPAADQGQTP